MQAEQLPEEALGHSAGIAASEARFVIPLRLARDWDAENSSVCTPANERGLN